MHDFHFHVQWVESSSLSSQRQFLQTYPNSPLRQHRTSTHARGQEPAGGGDELADYVGYCVIVGVMHLAEPLLHNKQAVRTFYKEASDTEAVRTSMLHRSRTTQQETMLTTVLTTALDAW